jgi:hypothetical protein
MGKFVEWESLLVTCMGVASTLELEMGLLTMAFLAGNQNGATPIKLGNLPLQVLAQQRRIQSQAS